ncbi:DUF2322 family protein [Candidatus Gracilibacteria bacterium]|nr:DUF2322 family protein [Candidatus Gracilibacteria bacterium]
MNFNELLDTLDPIKNYSVEIKLKTGEIYIIENKPGKLGSLRILQNHLGENLKSKEKIDLKVFCEYYEEWLSNNAIHTTIGFLDKYNKVGGEIRRFI